MASYPRRYYVTPCDEQVPSSGRTRTWDILDRVDRGDGEPFGRCVANYRSREQARAWAEKLNRTQERH